MSQKLEVHAMLGVGVVLVVMAGLIKSEVREGRDDRKSSLYVVSLCIIIL